MRAKREIKPKICGIYCLEAVSGNPDKIGWKYIGQSEDCAFREYSHFHKMRSDNHYNPRLQNYYLKYGKKSLKFYILHECPVSELNFYEKFWIKCFNSRINGFNDSDGGDKPPAITRSGSITNRVTKETIHFKSIAQLCRERGFCEKGISALFQENSRSKCYKNWYATYGKWQPTTYFLISPEGERYEFTNKREFCKEHNLSKSGIYPLLRGIYQQHNGWKRPDSKETDSNASRYLTYSLISPSGEIFIGKNLAQFARSKNLRPTDLQRIVHNERPHHKGWRLYKDIV